MVNTKDQSNAIVYCVCCCLLTVSPYTEKTIKTFGGASLSRCMHESTVLTCGLPWILQKLLFLHTSFWREGFLNISNHLPDSSAFNAEVCELANLLTCVSQLCQKLNLPTPKELYRPTFFKH